jgi:hypothetical protein
VTLDSLARAWDEFFFAPTRPTAVASFRFAFGVLVLFNLMLLRPEWSTWFGPRGVLGLDTMRELAPGWRINAFLVLPPKEGSANAIFWILLVAAIFLTVGLATRLSSVVVFVGLASLHQRNIFMANSGDTLLCVTGFFLVFAPAGGALSADRLLRIWRGVETAEIRPRAPWAQRLIQIQVALVYFSSFWAKSRGSHWMDGTALYYALHVEQFQRFPVPVWLTSAVFVKLATWLTLALEFSLGVLVWFKDLRYTILLCGFLFHLCIEYSMNIPLFEWIMCSAYITFVEPDDMTRAWRSMCKRADAWMPAPLTVTYDGRHEKVVRTVNLLRALDVFQRLRFAPFSAADTGTELPTRKANRQLVVSTPFGPRGGWSGLQYAARVLPLLWVLALPWVAFGYFKAEVRA